MSKLRNKVLNDINTYTTGHDNVTNCYITSCDGARDVVSLQDLRTGQVMEQLFKLFFTGIDFIAAPAKFWGVLLSQGKGLSSGSVLLSDRSWTRPKVFARHPRVVSR